MLGRFITRFLIIGAISTILNYSIFLLLYKILQVHYIPAFIVGYSFGVCFSYVLNKRWTFGSEKKHGRELTLYIAVYVTTLLIGTILLHLLVENVRTNPLFASVLVIGVTTVANFLGLRLLVFR